MIRVYSFSVRLPLEAERVAMREIDRGRSLYNAMIAQYNPHPRRKVFDIISNHKLADSGLYTGTYFAVVNAFQQAVGTKRVGVWPGDPYRFRSWRSNEGAMVGVSRSKSAGATWGGALAGASQIFSVTDDGSKYLRVQLKISRDDEPIEFTAHIRRTIPSDAVLTKVYLVRKGTYGRRHKWELQVTFEADVAVVPSTGDRVGVDVGWKQREDGSLLVAVTSDGQKLIVPAYAIRMALRGPELQSERDNLANETRSRHAECQARSANGTAAWCEEYRPETEREYIRQDRELRCRQDHVRERYQNIRNDWYKKFAATLRGRAYILKNKLKEAAEKELPTVVNRVRSIASCFEVAQLLRTNGAIEVVCERLSDSLEPTLENAERIRLSGESGELLERPARKPVRKFRKRLAAA